MFIHPVCLKQRWSDLYVGLNWLMRKLASSVPCCVFLTMEDSLTGEWWISTEIISDIPEWCPSIVILLYIECVSLKVIITFEKFGGPISHMQY